MLETTNTNDLTARYLKGQNTDGITKKPYLEWELTVKPIAIISSFFRGSFGIGSCRWFWVVLLNCGIHMIYLHAKNPPIHNHRQDLMDWINQQIACKRFKDVATHSNTPCIDCEKKKTPKKDDITSTTPAENKTSQLRPNRKQCLLVLLFLQWRLVRFLHAATCIINEIHARMCRITV